MTAKVELIVSHKGKVLSKVEDGRAKLLMLSGRLGRNTTAKLVDLLLQKHKIDKSKGKLTLMAVYRAGNETVHIDQPANREVSLEQL
uniref:Uncharacterized protein n=1 Tax=Tetraselmis sp. GSL018 TaxID=582737 RepID=A0A061RXI6_9CHLO